MWLALPVVKATGVPAGLRLLLMVLSLVGVIGWGCGARGEPRVAQSQREVHVVLVKDGTFPNQYVRIWHGSGLTAGK